MLLITDPLMMIQSGNTSQVKIGVTALAASAEVLGVLTMARALSECQRTPSVLSNKVFRLVSHGVMQSTSIQYYSPSCLVLCCIVQASLH